MKKKTQKTTNHNTQAKQTTIQKQNKMPVRTDEEREENRLARIHLTSFKSYLATTRFNTQTREENRVYREQKKHNGCVYGTPNLISSTVPLNSNVFVLEMDNDKNEVFAIGLVINKPHCSKYHIYRDYNYNLYGYSGKYRIQRTQMSEEEQEIMKVFDQLCFRGPMHQKRHHGITLFPAKILWRCKDIMNLVKFVEDMFKRYISEHKKSNDTAKI